MRAGFHGYRRQLGTISIVLRFGPKLSTCAVNITLELLLLQVNLARWEPAHGSFYFRHPWKEYHELGDLLRSYAYCINSLSGIASDTKVVKELRVLGADVLKSEHVLYHSYPFFQIHRLLIS